jgi:hypothetical protein
MKDRTRDGIEGRKRLEVGGEEFNVKSPKAGITVRQRDQGTCMRALFAAGVNCNSPDDDVRAVAHHQFITPTKS